MDAKLFISFFLFLSFSTAVHAQWQTSGTTIYYNSGNVGIGTSAPTYKMDVNGTLRATTSVTTATLNTTNVEASGLIGFRLTDTFTYNNKTVGNYSLGWDSSATGAEMWLSGFSGMRFFTNREASLVVTRYGNVGIGINAPTNKLEVNGTIKAKEIRVESTGGADFVFEDHYELLSLDEVDAYIKENKHLPGILSAKEEKENGIGLAEMNTKLLQKIEELTLYTIQQQQEIQILTEKYESILELLKNLK